MTNNYFKVASTMARQIDLVVPFDDAIEQATREAWERAEEMRVELGARTVAVWRKPVHRGPWSRAPEVSE